MQQQRTRKAPKVPHLKAAVLEEHKTDVELSTARLRWNGACLQAEVTTRRDEATQSAQQVDEVDISAGNDRRL